ncbi:hypothetical protein D1BOALGB6SA_9366 [Olavius sp. associated proteobacterium Delta 1]|nr:hypothetical protein D1BOALGB6SA_9366 [Olavius sp. associated proteobacterium Delta 1]
MIAIIPVFLQSSDQFWRTPDGHELILKAFRSVLNARQIENLMVFTNDNLIINLAKSLGIDSTMIKDFESQDSELLPAGTFSSLTYLREILSINLDSLMILGFRNPLLTPELIDEASAKFKHSKAPALISVKTSIDHPCQLNAYYKIADIGLIHLFDENADISPYLKLLSSHTSIKSSFNQRNQPPDRRGTIQRLGDCKLRNLRFRLTKPFHFDWDSRDINDKGRSGLYFRTYDDYHIKYIPIEENPDRTSPEISPSFWIYDTGNTARVLFDLDSCPSHKEQIKTDPNFIMIGAAFSDSTMSAAMLKDPTTNKHSISFNSESLSHDSYFLRAMPIGLSPSIRNGVVEIELDEISELIPFDFQEKNACGIIYFLLQMAHNDTYDLQEPFIPNKRLWCKDNGSGKIVNAETGKEILGRQDFPDVFEPDGTLFIMKKDLIPSFDKEVLNGNADSFIMEENASIQIKSELDLLKYKAITRVAGISSI